MPLQFQGFWDRLGLQQWLQLKVKHQEKALNLTPPRGHESVKMIISDIDAVFRICTCNATNLAAMQVAQCMGVLI